MPKYINNRYLISKATPKSAQYYICLKTTDDDFKYMWFSRIYLYISAF